MTKYFLATVTIAGFVAFYLFSFIPFQPLEFEGSADQEYRAVKVDTNFYKKLSIVLKGYYVEHEVKEGKVFIRRTTSFDKELISNYTLKALRLEADSTDVDTTR